MIMNHSDSQLTTGLVSITFRQLAVPRIVELVAQAGLQAIEWGGDIHAPPGQAEVAREVRKHTEQAGLSVAAYGSYYRAGATPPAEFADVLDTALALDTPTIRVWAGNRGSAELTEEERGQVVEDLERIAALASRQGVIVACEYHGDTLTDTCDSALRLLRETADSELRFYWQPLHGTPPADRQRGLREVMPRLRHLHVYNWRLEDRARLPLAQGLELWRTWLREVVENAPCQPVACLLEFVRDDSPEQFLQDAKALQTLTAEFQT